MEHEIVHGKQAADASLTSSIAVMAGLDPAIHVFLPVAAAEDVDTRVKPAHDEI